MASKGSVMTKEIMDQIINVTTQSFRQSFDDDFIERAQTKKSKARNAMFAIIMNAKFIEHGKTLKSLAEMYPRDATNITSLVIWKLNTQPFRDPTHARVEGKTLRICDM